MKIKESYKGFSLIELLLTMMILGVISLLVAVTLNTIIKVSNSTNAKNLARSNSSYIMDLIKKTVVNARLDEVHLYNSVNDRKLEESSGNIVVTYSESPYTNESEIGNEIHIKLYGYDTWSCIGYFKDNKNNGYIVQSFKRGTYTPETCFSSDPDTSTTVILHSLTMDVSQFNIDKVTVSDEKNTMFIVDLKMEPLYWPLEQNVLVNSSVQRKSVISTEALTWY
jgi:prepilin-type N-terminal cleavage/methylation domain-containing protein